MEVDVGRLESGTRSGGVAEERRGTYGEWRRKSRRRGRRGPYIHIVDAGVALEVCTERAKNGR